MKATVIPAIAAAVILLPPLVSLKRLPRRVRRLPRRAQKQIPRL